MKVTIQNELNEYMHSHHRDTITLQLIHDGYTTGNIYFKHPRIRLHGPKHAEKYEKFEVDDIIVFIEKNVKAEGDTLEFVHEKLLGIHRCHVKGLDLDYTKDFIH